MQLGGRYIVFLILGLSVLSNVVESSGQTSVGTLPTEGRHRRASLSPNDTVNASRGTIVRLLGRSRTARGSGGAEGGRDDIGGENHHGQAGSMAIYSIPEPPPSETNGAGGDGFWDWTIFTCSMLIAFSSILTFFMVKNMLLEGIAEECNSLPCCHNCCFCC